jgi:DNA recombination protein RmuC
MQIALTIFIAVVVVLVALVIYFASRKQPASNDQGLNLILQQLNELSRTVDQKISEGHKQVNESLRYQSGESSRLIKEITGELVRVTEGQKQVANFADQLQSLQDILKNPKQRGVLGEYYLETLLKNTLPPGSYEMQYNLGKDEDGKELIPDAVVFVKDKIIPVDSKFSLENYNRLIETREPAEKEKLEKAFVNDLKNRITETSKYIQPSKGTMDFAFMFIPHEAIYYDLLINKVGALKDESENLIQRAASKYKVIIVSPTSFLAYLQTVLQGLKALQIEEKAVEIIKHVENLGKHIKTYEEFHGKLGNSLSTVINHYSASSKELKKIDKDVLKITGTGTGIDPLILDRPNLEE